MKKLFFLFMLSVLVLGFAWAQGFEDFENHALSGTNYLNGSFTGNNGVTWNYIHVTGEQGYPITNKGIILRRSGDNSKVYSSPISGGIGSFSIQMRKAFTGAGARQVALYINDVWVADSQTFNPTGADDTIHDFVVDNINIAGDIVIEVRHIQGGSTNRQLTIDNLEWTGYSSGAPTHPSITNITTIPATDITSTTDVHVSATITDADGTVEGAELYWGLDETIITNNISMSNVGGDTWQTDNPIPVQADGTVVYYYVYALDDEANDTQSPEYSYTVKDPKPEITVNPDGWDGFKYVYDEGPSASRYFTVSGHTLEDNIEIQGTVYYEVSLDNVDYFGSVFLSPVANVVAATQVHARLKAGLAEGTYNGVINITSTNADAKIYTCSGEVTAPPPPPPPGYFVDFEDATKTGYDPGIVSLNGLDWNMTQALIGNADGDMKEDTKAARIRNNGTMTMVDPKPNGIGEISLYYARANFSNDRIGISPTFVVEYSTDGINWDQAGNEIDLAGIDDLTLFEADVNVSGDVYVQIRQTGGDNGKRWNVDNIYMTDYDSGYIQIPNLVPTQIADGLIITIQGGDGEIISGTIPPFTNAAFVPTHSFVLNLLGGGPWNMAWNTTAPWGAYYRNGNWTAVENDGSGIYFMGITAAKDLGLPVVFGDVDPTLPVELSSFTVNLNATNQAVLNWISQSESNLTGYYIYRNELEDLSSALKISNLIEATNTSQEYRYSYIDTEIYENGEYYYWLEVSELDGSNSYHGPITLLFADGEEAETPAITPITHLKKVYPNPFNPSANIAFYLAETAPVKVQIYNSRGQLVRSFDLGQKEIGNHYLSWNGADEKGNSQSTGVYFFRMTAGAKTYQTKAVLMK